MDRHRTIDSQASIRKTHKIRYGNEHQFAPSMASRLITLAVHKLGGKHVSQPVSDAALPLSPSLPQFKQRVEACSREKRRRKNGNTKLREADNKLTLIR